MQLSLLQDLKQKLENESDLAKIWLFYMDNFADLPEFMQEGDAKHSSFLEAVVPKVCREIFGKKVKITGLLTIYIPDYQFFHAPFEADKRIGGLIYFEAITTGLIAVSAEFPPTALVKYSRFSPAFKHKPKGFYKYN
jgi:hypothetical protein